MKLSEHLLSRALTLDQAADEIGDVSVSGLRKWIAGHRTPRPDQMRRIFDWSRGNVAPNDFVLEAWSTGGSHLCPHPRSIDDGEGGADAEIDHVNASTPALQARTPR